MSSGLYSRKIIQNSFREYINVTPGFRKMEEFVITGGGQNNGKTKQGRNKTVLAALKEY